MSLNRKQYYTSGRTLKSKGNQTMLNSIEKNAYNPTRKLTKKRESFVNSELDEMKCGGLTKMSHGGTHESNDDEIVVVGKKSLKKYTDEDAYKDKMLIYNDWAKGLKVWEAAKTKEDLNKMSWSKKEQNEIQKAYKRLKKNQPDDPWLNQMNLNTKSRTLSDGSEASIGLYDMPNAPKSLIQTEEVVSDYPEGYVPIYYQGKPLPVEEYGYLEGVGMKSRNLGDMTSNPVLWMNKRKTDMQQWNKSGEYPWGYKFKNGGLTKMDNGGIPKLIDGTPGTSLVLQNISKGYRGRKGLLTPYLGYSAGRWGGGASGTPENNYGFFAGLDYSRPLSRRILRDPQTFGTIGGGIYGSDDGLGIKGFHSFGAPWKQMAIGSSIPQMRGTTTAGFDKVRGLYADFQASQNYPIIEDKGQYLTVGPTGGFGIQSKDMINDPALADDIISKMNLRYGLTSSYGRKIRDGLFNVTANVTADPIAGKVAKEENFDTDRVHFAPRGNITASYTLPLEKDKIKRKIAEQEAKEEAIEREQEAIARREEEAKRLQERESEFVKDDFRPLNKQFGGEVMELTDKEIKELRKGGHIVIEQ